MSVPRRCTAAWLTLFTSLALLSGVVVLSGPAGAAEINCPTPHGYWLAAADGGGFTFGGLRFVGIEPTQSGNGYWLYRSDREVFAYGDARIYPITADAPRKSPIVGMASTPTGTGYWMLTALGGLIMAGDATVPSGLDFSVEGG